MSNILLFDYEGSPIQFEIVDGKVMANATSMCQAFGKKPNDWLRLESAKNYISAVARKMRIGENELITIKKGGTIGSVQGTWIHEKLVIDLARWLNVDFAVWCDGIIAEVLRTGKVDIKKEEKPVSQAHIALQMAQALVDHENRLLSVENKLNDLLESKEKASEEIKLLERSPEEMPNAGLREKIKKLVNAYCKAKLQSYSDVWNIIYDRLYYRYHIAIKRYKKKSGETYLDVAERNEFLDKIFVIASSELTI